MGLGGWLYEEKGKRMKRNVSLEEISDGRLYGANDMVKADCHGCRGCHRCCTGMGNSVILDPYDMRRLRRGVNKSPQELLGEGKLELNVVDGCILPNLAMKGAEEGCGFLNGEGRCSIHPFRPGVCRLFPLGRYYEDGDFRYFLQRNECTAVNRSKVKISRWIDTPEQGKYHDFLCTWHSLLKSVEEAVRGREDGEYAKALNMDLLGIFYFEEGAGEEDFYGMFEEKVRRFRARHFQAEDREET